MEMESDQMRYLEEYLKHTGWGLYCNFILGVTCASLMIHAITYISVTYAVALSTCDVLFISNKNALRIVTSFLIGSAFGGLIANSLSDRYGRRRYLTYSLICMFFSSFTAAFAYNTFVVIGATLILGVGLETAAIQVKLLLVEVLCKEKRGCLMAFCNIFWTFGYALSTFLIVLIETPAILDSNEDNMKLTMWRTMFAVSGGASLIMACVCALLEESPRYYLNIGRTYLAYLLLKQLYAINKSSFAENFKVREEELNNIIKPYDLNYAEPVSYWSITKRCCWRLRQSTKLMFSKRFCQLTWIVMLLKTPTIIIGILQLNIVLSRLLVSATPVNSAEKFRGLDFIYPILNTSNYSKIGLNASSSICHNSENSRAFYTNLLLLAWSSLPGEIVCILLVDSLGRKLILFTGFLLASCCCLLMGFMQSKPIQLVAACFGMSSLAAVLSTISLVNMELFPTAVRATSNAITSFPGYVLSMFFLNFIVIEPQLFIIVLGIAYFCLSIFTCFMPEFKQKPLTE